MKYLAVFLAAAICGYFLYPVFNGPGPDHLTKVKKEMFQDFLGKEAKTFAETQDADQKLKAAEEMYGRIMILLLAELGLRSSHEIKQVVKSEPSTIKECEPVIIEKESCSEGKGSQATSFGQLAPKNDKAKKPEELEKEQWIKYATTPFLDHLKGNVKKLIGRLEGTLTHEGGPEEGRIDSLVMQFNLYQEEKALSGNYEITMTDPSGKTYSRNAGDGGNRSLKGVSDRPEAYFVEASPTSYFLLDLVSFPVVKGVYFDKGKRIGSVVLRKL